MTGSNCAGVAMSRRSRDGDLAGDDKDPLHRSVWDRLRVFFTRTILPQSGSVF